MIFVEDAETGEQIFVDTSDPGFRAAARGGRRAAGRPRRRRPDRAGVDLYTVTTDDDLVRALARIAELRRRRRAMSFVWPWLLLTLGASRCSGLAYRRLLRRRAARAAELAALGLVAERPGGAGRRRHVAPVALPRCPRAAARGAGQARGDGGRTSP